MYLIPNPQKIQMKDGCYQIPYDASIVMADACNEDVYGVAKILKDAIAETTGISCAISREKNAIGEICFNWSTNLDEEAYNIKISQSGVFVEAGSTSGALYAVQTLRQMLKQEGASLPALEIEDYAAIPNRGFYHDVTRGRIPTMSQLKRLADQCSYYKLNQLQLYVEHTFLFKEFSEVWRDDTPLTAEDIMEFDQYCKRLNIELVPSIASFGHLYKVLRSKTYRHLSEFEEEDGRYFSFIERMAHHTVDVTQDESFQMIRRMLEEFMPLFTSKHFNICSDETFDLGKGKAKDQAAQQGVHRLYIDFVKKLCEVVKENNKRPMFWGDIIAAQPESIKELPEDVICLTWDYGDCMEDTNVRKLYELGATQYLCPGVHGWSRMLNLLDYAYVNIAKMCRFAHKFNGIGVLNTDWGDYGHINHVDSSLVGMIYGAAFSWNKEILPMEEINRQISKLEYSDPTESFVDTIIALAKQDSCGWAHFVQYQEELRWNVGKLGEEKIYKNLNFEKAKECNDQIDVNVNKLYDIMKGMDISDREKVVPYLIMAQGQRLLNIVGATLDKYRYKKDNQAAEDPKVVASKLEHWTYQYKKLWRSVSKESELYRILDVFFWYADFLRSLA